MSIRRTKCKECKRKLKFYEKDSGLCEECYERWLFKKAREERPLEYVKYLMDFGYLEA